MKKLITLLLFVLFVSTNSYSQTTARKYEYAIVHKLTSDELKIFYGNNKEEDFSAIKNLDLKATPFKNTNSVVDALNYLDEQGYEFVSSVSVAPGSYQYTFKREIKK